MNERKKSTRELVLSELIRCKGEFVSGAKLAEKIGCSRNAVWKAIEALKEAGYRLEAVTNKGYRLMADTDILSKEAILSYFTEEEKRTGFAPTVIGVLSKTLSTNTELKKRLLEEELPEGTILISDEQTAGRGHGGHGFFSPKGGGLYLSVLIRQSLLSIEDRALSAKSAVAMVRAIQHLYGQEIRIRPINDLMAEDGGSYKKVGGILTEVSRDIETGDTEYAIVGVGLRVTRPKEGYPTDISEETTDLQTILSENKKGQDPVFDRSRLAAEFVRELCRALKDPGTEEEYRRLLIQQENEDR